MPTGNLPESGKKLWEEVYQKALKGSCDGDKECAASTAWKAVRNAGWSKDKEGKWKKKSLTTFSMYLTKATHNKKDGEYRWYATGSDTEDDLAGDNMTLELFSDFIERIEKSELAPEEYRSEYWEGGLPYLSIAHYPDLNGDGVPGPTDNVYIDGAMLKANGRFDMSKEIGRRAYDAVRKDLYEEKSDDEEDRNIRISIAFLDWKHKHKNESDYEFTRKSLDDICPECIKEIIKGEYGGRSFLKGQLVQFALTRIPMNERTKFGLEEKSMAEEILTRKDDAESIVGDLAEDLDEKAAEIGKSKALIIKSEEEVSETEEDIEDGSEEINEEIKQEVEASESEEKAKHKKDKEMADDEEEDEEEDEEMKKKSSSEVLSMFEELKSMLLPPEEPEKDEIDIAFSEFKSRFVEIKNSVLADEEKLQELQVPFDKFGETVISSVKSEVVEATEADVLKSAIASVLDEKLTPIQEELALLKAQSSANVKPPEQSQPVRRSLTSDQVNEMLKLTKEPAEQARKGTPISELAKRSVIGQ